ncbi:MAG: tetratricopeptide repeat protein [Magnetococcales bacterium]|nr:tetratricopeptide repeat protein [Magnetococcales bacterium]NGZ07533.1 tetratricopeptide repeat protein [Magnetococcales bacterium]
MTNISPPTHELRSAMTDVATLIDQKQWQNALEKLSNLKKWHPGHPHVLHLLGVVKQELGDRKGAMEALSQAVTLAPDNHLFQLDLGLALKQKGAHLPAQDRLHEVLRLNPACAAAHFHLGDLWMDQGQIDAAIQSFQQALHHQPDLLEAWINLGLCQKSQNRIEEAVTSFQTARRLQPDHAQTHVNLAMALLMQGDYAPGWRAYEWRFRLDQPSLPFALPQVPRWQGEALTGKTILLLGEQGFGDQIQFIRFADSLNQQGARVLVAVPGPLVTLLQRAPGVAKVQDHLEFQEPVDCFSPLLSVAGLLGVTADTIPATTGYLSVDPVLSEIWRERLHGTEFKVGLIWQGKPLHANDPLRRRSCTRQDLTPLAAIPGVQLFSLQKGANDPPDDLPITSLESELTDFAATAAIMTQMDLIISIDTAAAHLAGALGKPVWTLLPRAPDWRWGSHQATTPWYGTMRLFRQSVTDQWQEPVLAMAEELKKRP